MIIYIYRHVTNIILVLLCSWSIQYPVSSIQYPVSCIQNPVFSILCPVSCVQYPVSSIQGAILSTNSHSHTLCLATHRLGTICTWRSGLILIQQWGGPITADQAVLSTLAGSAT